MTMEFRYNIIIIIIDTKRPHSSTFTESTYTTLAKIGMEKHCLFEFI